MKITHKSPMSYEAARDLALIRQELSQDQPNTDKLFNLISGSKYTELIRKS